MSDDPKPAQAGDAETPAVRDLREQIAREAALHGLARIDGVGDRSPPNEKWTQGEWERRILECVPSAVEAQCFALADAIIALLPTTPPAEIRKALEPLANRFAAYGWGGVESTLFRVSNDEALALCRLLDALAVQQADGGGRGG